MPTLALSLIALAAATGPSLPHVLERRLVAWGLLAAALGIGSVAVAASGDIRLTDLGTPSVAIDAGLQLLGALLLLAAGVRGWMLPPHRRVASVMLAAVGMALGWLARPLLATAGLAADGAAIATGAIGGGVIWLVTRGLHALPFRARGAPPATVPLPAWSRRAVALGLVGGTAAVVGPDAWTVVVGALGAALATAFAPTAGRRPAPVLPVLAAVCLLPALWFMHTVAGPVGLRISSLDEVPFSPAAEAMLAPILALGAFGFFGLWPLRRWGRMVLVPVGVALLVRLGAAVPSGLEAWQTVLVPLGIVAACHAAFTADAVEAVGAWAWAAGVTGGTRGAILLGAAALMLATAPGAAQRAGALAGAWMGRAAWALAAAGGALALESVLRAQVVYAVIAAVALAVLIGMPGGEPDPAR
jgi:hypothetical protein